MKNVLLKVLAMILIFTISSAGCSNQKSSRDYRDIDFETPKDTKVIIKGYYVAPASLQNEDTIIIDGISKGEFVEIVVEGEIANFEHISLKWDDENSVLEDAEILNKFDRLVNQTIVIRTYMPCGIPFEKIRWQSTSGKMYEYIISEEGEKENYWERIFE